MSRRRTPAITTYQQARSHLISLEKDLYNQIQNEYLWFSDARGQSFRAPTIFQIEKAGRAAIAFWLKQDGLEQVNKKLQPFLLSVIRQHLDGFISNGLKFKDRVMRVVFLQRWLRFVRSSLDVPKEPADYPVKQLLRILFSVSFTSSWYYSTADSRQAYSNPQPRPPVRTNEWAYRGEAALLPTDIWYKILKVSETASWAQVKKAYHDQLRLNQVHSANVSTQDLAYKLIAAFSVARKIYKRR